jgi:hypothetical protein
MGARAVIGGLIVALAAFIVPQLPALARWRRRAAADAED